MTSEWSYDPVGGSITRKSETTRDNRDPREVGREAAARGEAVLRQLIETTRELDAAVKELRAIADELKGRDDQGRDRALSPYAEFRQRLGRLGLGIEP